MTDEFVRIAFHIRLDEFGTAMLSTEVVTSGLRAEIWEDLSDEVRDEFAALIRKRMPAYTRKAIRDMVGYIGADYH